MWVDPSARGEERIGWYAYKKGREPEIWTDTVKRITSKKIWVQNHPKTNARLYSCEQDAITGAYELFCDMYLSSGGFSVFQFIPRPTLGEASVVLRKLAELEFNLNNSDCRVIVVNRTETKVGKFESHKSR
jgi:hypothetical protein